MLFRSYLCSAISISCCFLSLGKDRESEKAELGVIAETLTQVFHPLHNIRSIGRLSTGYHQQESYQEREYVFHEKQIYVVILDFLFRFLVFVLQRSVWRKEVKQRLFLSSIQAFPVLLWLLHRPRLHIAYSLPNFVDL